MLGVFSFGVSVSSKLYYKSLFLGLPMVLFSSNDRGAQRNCFGKTLGPIRDGGAELTQERLGPWG